MIRIPLKQNRVTQTKAAGMPKTPPAATTNPVIPTSTNAPDSTEARLARQDAIVRRINNVGLSVIVVVCIATGVTRCIDDAHASKPAHANSARTPLNPIKNTSASTRKKRTATIPSTKLDRGCGHVGAIVARNFSGYAGSVNPPQWGKSKPGASNGIITTGTGFPCLVLVVTPQSEAVATPTDKRGFITPIHHGCGRDGATRKDARTASDVLRTSRPPFASRIALGGLFNIPEGI